MNGATVVRVDLRGREVGEADDDDCHGARIVATETAASVAGPAAMPERALIAAISSAIGTGARRRKKTRT